jgi:hypothetical protein
MIIKVMKKILDTIREMITIIVISFISFIALIVLLFLIVLMYIQYFIEDKLKWIYKKF